MAIVQVPKGTTIPGFNVAIKGYYDVSINDLAEPKEVIVVSRQNNTRKAYILDFNVALDIPYGPDTQSMSEIILIGDNTSRKDSRSVSKPGDSGSCVLIDGKLVGMLLGGGGPFSFVLPVRKTLNDYGFKPI